MRKHFVRASVHLSFTLPIIFSNLLNITGSFITMYLIAQLGKNELSAGALVYTIYSIYMTLALSFCIPVSIIIGRKMGSGELEKINSIFLNGLILTTLLAIPCILVMLNLYPILIFLHQPDVLSQLTANYFHVLSYSVLPFLYLLLLTQVVMGVSRPSVSLYMVIIGLPIGLFLSYGMLFGKFYMPKLGMVGAAYASVITSYVSLIGFTFYLYFRPYYRRFNLFSIKGFTFSHLKDLFNFGWPIAIQRSGEVFAFSILTFMMGLLGGNVLAAHQIILQYMLVAMIISFSFSQSSGILVGQGYGRNNLLQAKQEGYISISMGTFLAFIIAFIFFIFPRELISFYINTTNPLFSTTKELGIILFKISAFTLVFDSLRNITIGVLRGLYDMHYPMIVGVLNCWLIGIPAAYLLGFVFNKGAAGVCFGFMLGIFVSVIFLFKRLGVLTNP